MSLCPMNVGAVTFLIPRPLDVLELLMNFPNLTRTVAALAAFDAAHEPGDPGDPDGPLARAVGEAYGLDTIDRNNPKTCIDCVRPGAREPIGGDANLSFVRKMVRSFHEQLALSNEVISEVLAEESL